MLNRGVRLGRSLSDLVFVIGKELLNLATFAYHNVKGIKIGDEEVKIIMASRMLWAHLGQES